MLASPKSPDSQFAGSTPGVIGAQEVYKYVFSTSFYVKFIMHIFYNAYVVCSHKLIEKIQVRIIFAKFFEENLSPHSVRKICTILLYTMLYSLHIM